MSNVEQHVRRRGLSILMYLTSFYAATCVAGDSRAPMSTWMWGQQSLLAERMFTAGILRAPNKLKNGMARTAKLLISTAAIPKQRRRVMIQNSVVKKIGRRVLPNLRGAHKHQAFLPTKGSNPAQARGYKPLMFFVYVLVSSIVRA